MGTLEEEPDTKLLTAASSERCTLVPSVSSCAEARVDTSQVAVRDAPEMVCKELISADHCHPASYLARRRKSS